MRTLRWHRASKRSCSRAGRGSASTRHYAEHSAIPSLESARKTQLREQRSPSRWSLAETRVGLEAEIPVHQSQFPQFPKHVDASVRIRTSKTDQARAALSQAAHFERLYESPIAARCRTHCRACAPGGPRPPLVFWLRQPRPSCPSPASSVIPLCASRYPGAHTDGREGLAAICDSVFRSQTAVRPGALAPPLFCQIAVPG